MARTQKRGLDYFPLDVDIFENAKIEAVAGEFGVEGELLVVKLFCAIYKNGYYIVWNELLKMQLMKRIPGISEELLERVVNRLVEWGLFDETLFFTEKVLTSVRIQETYKEATKRRKEVEMRDYGLLDVYNNPQKGEQNEDINPQSKEKESKENQIKENQNKENHLVVVSARDASFDSVVEFYEDNFGAASSFIMEDLYQQIEKVGPDLVKESLIMALKQHKPYAYAVGILNNWQQRGIHTLEQAKADQQQFQQKRQSKWDTRRVETVPDWVHQPTNGQIQPSGVLFDPDEIFGGVGL